MSTLNVLISLSPPDHCSQDLLLRSRVMSFYENKNLQLLKSYCVFERSTPFTTLPKVTLCVIVCNELNKPWLLSRKSIFNLLSSILFQVMAWCRQATSHYLSQCWPRSMSPYGVIRPQWLKFSICLQMSNSNVKIDRLYLTYWSIGTEPLVTPIMITVNQSTVWDHWRCICYLNIYLHKKAKCVCKHSGRN